jgi:hypothetical protein
MPSSHSCVASTHRIRRYFIGHLTGRVIWESSNFLAANSRNPAIPHLAAGVSDHGPSPAGIRVWGGRRLGARLRGSRPCGHFLTQGCPGAVGGRPSGPPGSAIALVRSLPKRSTLTTFRPAGTPVHPSRLRMSVVIRLALARRTRGSSERPLLRSAPGNDSRPMASRGCGSYRTSRV